MLLWSLKLRLDRTYEKIQKKKEKKRGFPIVPSNASSYFTGQWRVGVRHEDGGTCRTLSEWRVLLFFFFLLQLWPHLSDSCVPPIILTTGDYLCLRKKKKKKSTILAFFLWGFWENGGNFVVVCGLNRNNSFHSRKKKKKEKERTVRFLPPESLPSPSHQNKTEPEHIERGGVVGGWWEERNIRFPWLLILMTEFVVITSFQDLLSAKQPTLSALPLTSWKGTQCFSLMLHPAVLSKLSK